MLRNASQHSKVQVPRWTPFIISQMNIYKHKKVSIVVNSEQLLLLAFSCYFQHQEAIIKAIGHKQVI